MTVDTELIVSHDGGRTSFRANVHMAGNAQKMNSVCCSRDGTRVYVAASGPDGERGSFTNADEIGGGLYMSQDSGLSWARVRIDLGVSNSTGYYDQPPNGWQRVVCNGGGDLVLATNNDAPSDTNNNNLLSVNINNSTHPVWQNLADRNFSYIL